MPSERASGRVSDASSPGSTRFVFSGLELPEDEDPFGIWQLASPSSGPAASDVAFAVQDGMTDEMVGLRWYVDLPSVPRDARSELDDRWGAVQICQAQLDVAERRLLQLGGPQAFAVSGGPEAALLAEVAALQRVPTAYGVGGQSAVTYGVISDKADQLLLQFRRLVQYYARVETAVGGQLVALTSVDWSGDYQTTWQEGVTVSDMDLHLAAVRLALTSRQALVRLVTVVTTGALSLATKASIPGGQILLLPAVYKYVRDVLEELGAYVESRGISLFDM